MTFSPEELVAKWTEFFETSCGDRILEIGDLWPEERSLTVSFEDVNRYDVDFGDELLTAPARVLGAGEKALQQAYPAEGRPSPRLRVSQLPVDARVPLRGIRQKHLGRMLRAEGMITKTTEVTMRVEVAMFRCLRCGNAFVETQEPDAFREPLECHKDDGGCGRTSSSTKFKLIPEESAYIDIQKAELQEAPESLRGGEIPRRLPVYIEDDIAGQVLPGMRVTLNGVLRASQRSKSGAKSSHFDYFLDVLDIEVLDPEQYFDEVAFTAEEEQSFREAAAATDIFDQIRDSIAPSLAGLEREKEALALQLFSGVTKRMPDGRRIRGDIHILLIGDPGLGKSELLEYMRKLARRSVAASGPAATRAGLVAAAVKDEFGEGRWSLEAGVMVLADQGLALVDELEKMREEDQEALHPAMEQQKVDIAKAGITATLQTRCALLAAANPKLGRFVLGKAITEQIGLRPSLLSRFDCIFTIHDEPDPLRDGLLADHILKGHLYGEMEAGGQVDATMEHLYKPPLKPEFLRKYVTYARRTYPVMTPEAMNIIKGKYMGIRQSGRQEEDMMTVSITPRQLEGFIRLAEASARARLSPAVTHEDAQRSVDLVEYWLQKVAGGEGGIIDIDRIASPFSSNQRQDMIELREILIDLERGLEVAAEAEEIFRRARERGIPEERARTILERWKKEGEVYSPTDGKYKLIQRL